MKLDPRTVSGYFIGYAEKSKGYNFYCLSHTTGIVESRNAKFLESDLSSGSDELKDIVPERDHSDTQSFTSSIKLVVIHNAPSVQLAIE